MKKLMDMTEAVSAALARIGEEISRRDAEDPTRATYTCCRCQDTGFKVTARRGMVYGTACEYCMSGVEVQRAEEAARSKREKWKSERLSQRKGNRLVLIDAALGEGEDANEIPF